MEKNCKQEWSHLLFVMLTLYTVALQELSNGFVSPWSLYVILYLVFKKKIHVNNSVFPPLS